MFDLEIQNSEFCKGYQNIMNETNLILFHFILLFNIIHKREMQTSLLSVYKLTNINLILRIIVFERIL